MKAYRPNLNRNVHQTSKMNYYDTPSSQSTSLVRPSYTGTRFNLKGVAVFALVVLVTNLLTHSLFNPALGNISPAAAADINSLSVSRDALDISSSHNSLFLMDKASVFVHNLEGFEQKVREVSHQLGVPPEWLMAVMYSESKFDAAVKNFKGSGATGLIQFMPATAGELGISLSSLGAMSHVQQMDYVYKYLNNVRNRYGSYGSLTELYLGILYPRAIGQDYCYTLYAKPSKSYRQNSGLDENRDGRVSVSDIDKRMQRLYPEAYIAKL